MALAAVADDDDLLSLDEIKVCVAIVVNTHVGLTPAQAPMAVSFCVVLLGGMADWNKAEHSLP
jgi:hypothetical protein